MVKLVFLDLDGVLVTHRPGCIEPGLLVNLKRLIESTGAEIVLSSDWRRHAQAREEARRVLRTAGMDFIACTPCMSAYIPQRPTEILQWKRDYMERLRREGGETISNWVAIDDRALLDERNGRSLTGHFCRTNPVRGLTDKDVDECIRILQTPPPTKSASCGPTHKVYPNLDIHSTSSSPTPGNQGATGLRRRLAEEQLNMSSHWRSRPSQPTASQKRDFGGNLPRSLIRDTPKGLYISSFADQDLYQDHWASTAFPAMRSSTMRGRSAGR